MAEIAAAIIGALAAIAGVLGAGVIQLRSTRIAIEAERRRVGDEATLRTEETRKAHILDALAEILSLSEVQAHASFDYSRLLALTHRTQLLINRAVLREADLNGALNQLMLLVHEYQARLQDEDLQAFPENERQEMRLAVLRAHAALADAGAEVLRTSSDSRLLR